MKHLANIAFKKLIATRLYLCLVFVLTILLGACNSENQSDEELILKTLDSLEQAAQERKMGDLMEWVDPDYSDDNGRSWKDVRAIAQLQFLRNRKLYIYKVIKGVDIRDQQADVIVFVAAAGKPIDGPETFTKVRAELIRFDLKLIVKDSVWQITSSSWRPVQAKDFLL